MASVHTLGGRAPRVKTFRTVDCLRAGRGAWPTPHEQLLVGPEPRLVAPP